ncbi:twin-arginine translocase subunit TatC [Haloferula chungangensis]|uniref:Sec-independent protein translocase protein TatC n=1 Tax=Haloferula chungangensis TaxID=1048331 RepID=A0ABW2L4Q8_9BACT
MYLLKKVFQLRDKANPDMEKPFLEHLEDLRVMITRVVLTLIIAMAACFAFQKHVMDVLRAPVEQVWEVKTAEKLPTTFTVADWEKAKELERAALALSDAEREAFLQQIDEGAKFNVECVRLVRAAKKLEGENLSAFLDATTSGDELLREQVDALLATGANPEASGGRELNDLSTLQPTEGFMLSMKLAFFSGIIVSFPLLLLFTLQFVLPGLHDSEKKMLWPAMAVGFGLFLAGVLFAYFVVLPRALVFFASWDEGLGVASDWRIGWYISFATQFTLLFGLSFELPVVVMVFVKLGLLSYEMMNRTRSYAILAIVVLAAIITPTSDILTLSLMAVPMYVLYEACIWLAYFDEKKKRREQEEDDKKHLSKLLADEDEDHPLSDSGDSEDDHYDHDDHELDPHETEEGEEEDSGDDHRPWDEYYDDPDRHRRDD